MTNPSSLCSVCAPIDCYNCNREIVTEEKVYILPGDIAKAQDFAYKETSTCRSCFKKKPVNSRDICKDCQSEDQIVCKDCHEEKVCLDCGKLHYNRGAYCNTCKKNLVLCPDCRRNEFIPVKDQLVCHTCFHDCVGCGKSYSPQTRMDTHCETCTHLIDIEKCVSCKTSSQNLNVRGHCTTCSGLRYDLIDTHVHSYFCRICKVTRVDADLGICDPCLTGKDDCPTCGKLKPKTSYLCKTCIDSGRREKKNNV